MKSSHEMLAFIKSTMVGLYSCGYSYCHHQRLKDTDSCDINPKCLRQQFIRVVFLSTSPQWTLSLSLNKVY